MMRMRTGLLLLAGVVVLACVMSSVNARALESAAATVDGVATAAPLKPISTVISWKTGKKDKYGDKYAHKHGEHHNSLAQLQQSGPRQNLERSTADLRTVATNPQAQGLLRGIEPAC